MKKSIVILFSIICVFILSSFVSNYFEISKNLEIFNNIYREIETSYVESVSPGELMHETIDYMLKQLDPWTVYIPESEVEDYRERSITGQYGGIGSKIRKIEDFVVIAEPFKNSPADKAGLKIGDKIIEIDGKNMANMNTEDISELLRGAEGTKVNVRVETTEGISKSVEINRGKIKTPTVPHYELINENIGYIRLTQFKQKSAEEVKNALVKLDTLSKNRLNGIILDLRNNPGGLLRECLSMVNFFVPKNDTILKSKGKLATWDKAYIAKNPVMYNDLPVVVLINKRSASASEIVAGCIQDFDRGVIIGETSFGKGLIQQNKKLSYNTQLKVTVAKYYTPSGRCIQNHNTDERGKRIELEDSIKSIFFTRSGRQVYGGGGITPDIEIKAPDTPDIVLSLIRNNCVFNFGGEIINKVNFPQAIKEFEISEEIYAQFQEYLKKKDYPFTSDAEEAINLLEEEFKEEFYLDNIAPQINLLKSEIIKNKKQDILHHKAEIKKIIANDLILRKYYQDGLVEYSLKDDSYINEAIKVLKDTSKYNNMLLP